MHFFVIKIVEKLMQTEIETSWTGPFKLTQTSLWRQQGCTTTSVIGSRPIEFAKCLIFQWRGQMSHYSLVSVVSVWLFFVTLGHSKADPVTSSVVGCPQSKFISNQ